MDSLETTQEIAIDDKAYQELLNEVEYRCSLCEAVHEDMEVLNAKIEAVFRWVADKTKKDRDSKRTLTNWTMAFYVASEIRQAVCLKKSVHQICGIDSGTVEGVYSAIKERLEFLLGYSIPDCE